jgi:hypothetical protein
MTPALKDGESFGRSFELFPNSDFELPGPKGPGFLGNLMNLNLGRIGPWFSDRLILENDRDSSFALRVENNWCSRTISWISSSSSYSKENRDAVALFQSFLTTSMGENRLRRIGDRYGIHFDEMQQASSPLLSRNIAKILTGIQDVKMEDMEELILTARGGIEEWPEGIDFELRDVLRDVENSEALDKGTFEQVIFALKNPITADCTLPGFSRPVHGGRPTEELACYYFEPFLADLERLFLCERNRDGDFENFVHDFASRIIHREMEVGMLIPAPGDHQFYRVAAKIITGEGMVSYCLVPATLDTDLPPIRFYRGTCARPCGIDAISTLITDLESDLGERAFQSGKAYDQILDREFPPFAVQAGHSLGSTILQKKLVEDGRIKTAYLFNGPGITEGEVARFNERIALDADLVRLIIRDTDYDTASFSGKVHLGFQAPEGLVDYLKYTPTLAMKNRGVGYMHTMVWDRETRYYGIEGVDPDQMLERKNLSESNECLRGTIGPIIAKILQILRAIFRYLFGSRADEQRGVQIGRFVEGHWKIDHIRPEEIGTNTLDFSRST